jgi:membrane protease YdiL (CAAX protease family)
MLIEIGLTTFYAEQISYIILAVFLLVVFRKILIENDIHIKKLVSFSSIPAKNIIIALTISFLSVPLALGFNAIEVLFIAQFSLEMAANLWDFKLQEVVLERNYKLGGSIGVFLLFALVHSIIGPLVEELTFRAPLLSKRQSKYTLLGAIFISSVLFTIIHSNKQYLELFIFSLFVAFLTIKTGRILYAFIVHAGYNLFSWLMEGHNMMLLFTNKPIDSLHKITLWKGELIFMIISLILIIFLLKALLKGNNEKQFRVSNTVVQ